MRTLLDRGVLDGLSKPIETARGLPNEAFVSPEFLALENKTLFPRNWVFAGRQSQVPNPGDIAQIEIAGDPLILVRGKDNVVRVFYNVCPHRGARLVSEDRSGGAVLTCRYHAWTFELSGELRARAHFHGPGENDRAKPDQAECPHLFPVRSQTWHDAVFVNLDGEAGDLQTHLAPLDRQADGLDISQFDYATTVTGRFNCNWKLAIENWSDVYHVFAVHPLLDSLMDAKQRSGMSTDRNLIYCRWGYDPETIAREGLPMATGLTGAAASSSFMGHLFPGLCVSFHPTMFLLWDYKPLTHDWTELALHIYMVGEAATDQKHASLRADKVRYYTDLNAEDDEVCRLLQEGRSARGYDGGRFAPYWDTGTLYLAKLVAESVMA